MLVYLLSVLAAWADTPESGTSWGQVGSIIGVVLASAVASGTAVFGAGRISKTPPPGPPAPEGFYARIDERTEGMQRDINVVRKKLHRHGNVLLVLMSKADTTPAEDKALKALQEDSEEDDTGGGK